MSEPPTDEQVLTWIDTLSNWGRWGPDDELGTVNLITPEKRRSAATLVREGITVSCARPIGYELDPDAPHPVRHFMTGAGENVSLESYGSTGDAFLIAPHGRTITHVDALCHWTWRGRIYNGRPATVVTTREGATAGAVDLLGEGVVTRGVLLDIAALRGQPWLEGGEAILPEDLQAAEQRQGVRVESGDALLIRTGYARRRTELGPYPSFRQPGLQAACLPWLREREVALLACDTINDVSPSGYQRVGMPIHTVGLVAMGLWLIDNCDHEALAGVCTRLQRWAFLFMFAPLRFRNATASPVNPVAVF